MIKKIKAIDYKGKEARDFCALFAGIMVGLSLYFVEASFDRYFLYAALYFIAGLVWPMLTRPLFLAWMSLSMLLGEVVFSLLFSIFYLILILPIGLLKRIAKGDFLSLSYDAGKESYWDDYDAKRQEKSSLERMF